MVLSLILLSFSTVQNYDRRFIKTDNNKQRWEIYTEGPQIANLVVRCMMSVIDFYMFFNFMSIFLFFKRARENRRRQTGREITRWYKTKVLFVYIISVMNMYDVIAQLIGNVLIYLAGCKAGIVLTL